MPWLRESGYGVPKNRQHEAGKNGPLLKIKSLHLIIIWRCEIRVGKYRLQFEAEGGSSAEERAWQGCLAMAVPSPAAGEEDEAVINNSFLLIQPF